MRRINYAERIERILQRLSRERMLSPETYAALVSQLARRFAPGPFCESRVRSRCGRQFAIGYWKGRWVGGDWDRAQAQQALHECRAEGRRVTVDIDDARIAARKKAENKALREWAGAYNLRANLRQMDRQLKELQKHEARKDNRAA